MLKQRANPAPLGLMGFGLTTMLLNIHNAGFFPVDAMILGMGIFFGGIAQIIAGIMEYRNDNTFGCTAFISYGSFWLTLVAAWIMPGMELTVFAQASQTAFMGWYLFLWGTFTLFMFIGTLARYPRVKQFIFGSLTVLFYLLAIKHWVPADLAHTIGIIAGFEGIVVGAAAFYLSMATIINMEFGRTVLPIGDWKAAQAKPANVEDITDATPAAA